MWIFPRIPRKKVFHVERSDKMISCILKWLKKKKKKTDEISTYMLILKSKH